MSDRPLVMYVAAYSRTADAELDYDVVKRLYSGGRLPVYDATLFERDAAGRLQTVNTLEGHFFPPCLIRSIASGTGCDRSDLLEWRGLSADDLDSLEALFRQGIAWLIVISGVRLAQVLKDSAGRVIRDFEKPLTADIAGRPVTSVTHERQ